MSLRLVAANEHYDAASLDGRLTKGHRGGAPLSCP